MRGIHSVVDDLRRQVFTEVARLAYEGGDFSRIDALPYKIIPGEDAQYRHDVFLERAIVTERLRLACGLPLRTAAEMSLASDGIEEAAKPENTTSRPSSTSSPSPATPARRRRSASLPTARAASPTPA